MSSDCVGRIGSYTPQDYGAYSPPKQRDVLPESESGMPKSGDIDSASGGEWMKAYELSVSPLMSSLRDLLTGKQNGKELLERIFSLVLQEEGISAGSAKRGHSSAFEPDDDDSIGPVEEKQALSGGGQPMDGAIPAAPAGEASAPAVIPTGAPPAAPAGGPSASGQDVNVDGGGRNSIAVKNTSDREQSYALFTNPEPGASSSFGKPNGFITLKPGESANFKVPDQHSGYIQQMNDYSKADYDAGKSPDPNNFKATRAEYTFNKDGSLYFNDSNIDGYNSALKMSANGETGGHSDSILAEVEKTNPGLIEKVGGQKVINGSQFFTDKTNFEARDALDRAINHNQTPSDLNGNKTTYVMPDDNLAVRGTKSNSLALEFGNA